MQALPGCKSSSHVVMVLANRDPGTEIETETETEKVPPHQPAKGRGGSCPPAQVACSGQVVHAVPSPAMQMTKGSYRSI